MLLTCDVSWLDISWSTWCIFLFEVPVAGLSLLQKKVWMCSKENLICTSSINQHSNQHSILFPYRWTFYIILHPVTDCGVQAQLRQRAGWHPEFCVVCLHSQLWALQISLTDHIRPLYRSVSICTVWHWPQDPCPPSPLPPNMQSVASFPSRLMLMLIHKRAFSDFIIIYWKYWKIPDPFLTLYLFESTEASERQKLFDNLHQNEAEERRTIWQTSNKLGYHWVITVDFYSQFVAVAICCNRCKEANWGYCMLPGNSAGSGC